MKTLNEIYSSIKQIFYNKTDIDIQAGSTIDYFVLSASNMIEEGYKEIEDNKDPHLYTNLTGDRIDNMGILCGITRRPNESDTNYLYRVLKWNTANKAANSTSIESALMDMTYASYAKHIPQAFGCGTAAISIIPKVMDDDGKKNAIAEAKARLKDIVSPSSYIEYVVPEIAPVAITCLIKADASDIDAIKRNITAKVIKYVNGIAPGEYLEVGYINKIGSEESNVVYFNVSNLIINNEEIGIVSALQGMDSKFLIDEKHINWVEVE